MERVARSIFAVLSQEIANGPESSKLLLECHDLRSHVFGRILVVEGFEFRQAPLDEDIDRDDRAEERDESARDGCGTMPGQSTIH